MITDRGKLSGGRKCWWVKMIASWPPPLLGVKNTACVSSVLPVEYITIRDVSISSYRVKILLRPTASKWFLEALQWTNLLALSFTLSVLLQHFLQASVYILGSFMKVVLSALFLPMLFNVDLVYSKVCGSPFMISLQTLSGLFCSVLVCCPSSSPKVGWTAS